MSGTPTGFYENLSDPYRVAFGCDRNPGWRFAACAAALTLGYGIGRFQRPGHRRRNAE